MKAKVEVSVGDKATVVNIKLPTGQRISVQINDNSDSIDVTSDEMGSALQITPLVANQVKIKSVNH